MKLSIKDRLAIASLYPKEATLVEQMVVKGLNDKVRISPEEAASIKLRTEGSTFLWDDKLEKDIEVTFPQTELVLLKGQIEKLDKDRKITLDMVDLCMRIKEEK